MINAARLLILTALLFLAGILDVGASIPKTRVGTFFTSAPVLTTSESSQAAELQPEKLTLYGESASGSTLWTHFDPEGLASEEWEKQHPVITAVSGFISGLSGAFVHALTPSQGVGSESTEDVVHGMHQTLQSGGYDPTRNATAFGNALGSVAIIAAAKEGGEAGKGPEQTAEKTVTETQAQTGGDPSSGAQTTKPDQQSSNTGNVKTPNAAMRANANATGTYVDPLTGSTVPATGNLAADHIVPKSWIKDQPGFSDMTAGQQSWLLNHPLNTQGLPGTFNASKGAKMPGDWTTYKGQPLSPGYIQNDAQRGPFLQNFIQTQIKNMSGGGN